MQEPVGAGATALPVGRMGNQKLGFLLASVKGTHRYTEGIAELWDNKT